MFDEAIPNGHCLERILDEFRANPSKVNLHALCEQHSCLGVVLAEKLQAILDAFIARQKAAALPSRSESLNWSSRTSPREEEIFGPYELLRYLGEGGFGRVFHARRVDDLTEVAIKILNPSLAWDDATISRLKLEAELSERFRHPLVVPVHQVGKFEEWHFLEMPYIDGENLADVVGHERILPERAARIIRAAALACAAMHSRGIIHRDLKPSNILLAGERVLVLDFGLAHLPQSTLPAFNEIYPFGTPQYRAPEQVTMVFGRAGPAADIYALGATLYFLLTASAPFPEINSHNEEIRFQQIRARGWFWRPLKGRVGFPPLLRDICSRCLETFPEDRYQSASELATDLRKYLKSQRLVVQRPSAIKRFKNLRRLYRRPADIILFAVFILTAIAVWSFVGWSWAKHSVTLVQREQRADHYGKVLRDIQALWEQGEVSRARSALLEFGGIGAEDLRGFEWDYWNRLTNRQPPIVVNPTVPSSDRPAFAQLSGRLTFNQSATRLALIGVEGEVLMLDASTGKVIYLIETAALDVCFCDQDKHWLALLRGERGGLEVRDSQDGHLLFQFGEDRNITSVSADSHSPWIITGHKTGEVKCWVVDWASGKANEFATLPNSAAPPSQKILATAGRPGGPFASAPFEPISSPVISLGFLPPTKLFAGYENGRIRIWELKANATDFCAEIDVSTLIFLEPDQFAGPVTGCARHPNRPVFATQTLGTRARRNSRVGELRLWGSAPMSRVSHSYTPYSAVPHYFEPTEFEPNEEDLLWTAAYAGRRQPVFDINGLLYVPTDYGVAIRDVNADGPPIDRLCDGTYITGLHAAGTRLAAVDQNGRVSIFHLQDRASDQILWRPPSHYPTISSFALSKDGESIAVVSEFSLGEQNLTVGVPLFPDSVRTLYTIRPKDESYRHVATIDGTFPPRIQPLITRPVQFVDSDHAILISQHQVSAVDATDGSPGRVPFSEVEELQACDGTIRLRIVRGEYHERPKVVAEVKAELIRSGHVPMVLSSAGPDNAYTAFALSDGGHVAAISSRDGSTTLWETQLGTAVHRLSHPTAPTTLTLTSDGQELAVGLDNGVIEIWDITSARKKREFVSHRRSVTGIAYFHDQNRMVSCSGMGLTKSDEGGQVIIWNSAIGQPVLELKSGRPNLYVGVAVGPEDEEIFAAANSLATQGEGAILVWRSKTAEAKNAPN